MTRRPVPSLLRPTAGVRSGLHLWRACCTGAEPAEALDTRDREDLVATLVERGWTDLEIALLTRMSTYTVGRIRDRVGLSANQPDRLAA